MRAAARAHRSVGDRAPVVVFAGMTKTPEHRAGECAKHHAGSKSQPRLDSGRNGERQGDYTNDGKGRGAHDRLRPVAASDSTAEFRQSSPIWNGPRGKSLDMRTARSPLKVPNRPEAPRRRVRSAVVPKQAMPPLASIDAQPRVFGTFGDFKR